MSAKAMNERLRTTANGLIARREFPGRNLRVEHKLTTTGQKLAAIIEQIRDLEHANRTGDNTA